jgi:hypothetical protein
MRDFVILGSKRSDSGHKYVTTRRFKQLDQDRLLDDLHNVPWHTIDIFNDVDDC